MTIAEADTNRANISCQSELWNQGSGAGAGKQSLLMSEELQEKIVNACAERARQGSVFPVEFVVASF